jgi:peptidoglycan/LPS O-acetylase OafA/YrhL
MIGKTAPNIQRVPALDLLRFMAASGVMLYHYVSHRPRDDGSLPLMATVTQQGYLGVDVFFMISGFVILWSAHGRSGAGFARARILRLYPEFWLALLITTLTLYLLSGAGRHLDVLQLLGNATMIPQYVGVQMIDGVYWTLAVEIKFYVLVFLLIVSRQIARLELALYGWLVLTAIAEIIDVGSIVRSAIIYPYGAHFAAGGLFYLMYESGWTRARAAATALALPLCVFSSLSQMDQFVDAARITMDMKIATAAVIGAAFACFAMLPRLQSLRWPGGIALIGGLTYPLYLTHNVGKAIFLQRVTAGPLWVRTIVAIAFSLTLAWLVMWLARRFITPALKRLLDACRLRDKPVAKPAVIEGIG